MRAGAREKMEPPLVCEVWETKPWQCQLKHSRLWHGAMNQNHNKFTALFDLNKINAHRQHRSFMVSQRKEHTQSGR